MVALVSTLALLTVLLLGPIASPAPAAAAQDRPVVLTHGHVDGFETTYDATTGRLVVGIKDDTRIYDQGAVHRDPSTVTIAYQDPRSTTTLPAAQGAWAFLGQHGGTVAWVASQTGGDQAYSPWVGWSTERLSASLQGTGIVPAAGQPVTLDVTVEGPGDVFTYQMDSFGQPFNRYVDTTTGTGRIPVAANAHVHTNWIFTAEGDYHLTVTPSLATTAGTTVTGDPASYRVRVGEPALETTLDLTGATSYPAGGTADLRVTQTPETGLETYRWETAPTGSQEYSAVDGLSGATYDRVLSLADDGTQVRAVLLDGETVVATSPHVTLTVAPAPDPVPPVVVDPPVTPTPTPPVDPTPPVPTPTRPPVSPAPPVTPVPPTTGPVVLDRGHLDLFDVTYSDGRYVLAVKDDTRLHSDGSVFRDPADVVVAVDEHRSARTVPDAPAFGFLGAPGSTFYALPQVQDPELPWPGWSTERLAATLPAGTTADEVRLDVQVSGPGEVQTWQLDGFGNVVNRHVTGTSGTIPVAVPAHVHTSWAFTELGTYRLTVTPSGNLSDGTAVTGRAATYTVQVGPVAGQPTAPLAADLLLADADLVAGNSAGASAAPASVVPGDQIKLTVPGAAPADWVMPVFYSEPRQTTWAPFGSGSATATVPTDLPAGQHKVAAYDPAGALLGWAAFTVTASGPVDDRPAPTVPAPGAPGTAPDGALPPAPGGDATDLAPACLATPVVTEVDTPPLGGITSGHLDLGAVLDDGELTVRLKDDRTQPPAWVAPSSVVLRLDDAARSAVPVGTDFSFLGAPGDPVWSVGSVQQAGVPWLGWNTQHESLVQGATGAVTFSLDSVEGPGDLAVYGTGSFGGLGQRYLGTVAGFPSTMSVPLNQHIHGTWSFTAAGVYSVTLTQTATLADGRTTSGTGTLVFSVGDSSSTRTETTYVGRTADGAECELTAEQQAEVRAAGGTLASTGTGGTAEALSVTLLLVVVGGSLLALTAAARRRRPAAPVEA